MSLSSLCACVLLLMRLSLDSPCLLVLERDRHRLNHIKITQQDGCVMNLMLATPYTLMLKVVNAINEGVLVIHRIWISVEVHIALQVKLRITRLRILRLRVRIRAKKAKFFFIILFH